jgi:sugar-phosphatase
VTAIIFDLDGLLIDSEPLWVRAEIEVFAAEGLVITAEQCPQTKGLRTDDVIRHWFGSHIVEIELKLIERVATLIATEGVALAGIDHVMALARTLRCPLALASSSPMRVIEAALGRLQLKFDVVQSAEKEPYGKPHPGVFLKTAERLGVDPVSCVVLEDSLNGVIAAKAARMRCIAVPPAEHLDDRRFAIADVILPSLAAITLEHLK